KRKLKEITKRKWSISLEDRITKLNQVIRGWINYYRIADMKIAMTRISEHLRRRIRCIIWKQWKVSKKRIESLIKLGCDSEQAKAIAYSRKSYWNSSLYISIFITNNRLKEKGLVFPLDHYLKVHAVI
ncbi:MAG: group II intron maturase-specific domain-containing protein, partial [Anaerovorax sp.]